jgi:RNA polymerase sigma-70 factor (ECF subfamily)
MVAVGAPCPGIRFDVSAKSLSPKRLRIQVAADSPSQARLAERRLLAAARAGDRRALDQLVERVAPPVHRFGRMFCRDRDDAEDVLQETLASIVRHFRSFRGDASLSSWAFVVARRACARLRRRRDRERVALEAAGRDATVADPAAGPERAFERGALGSRLAAAIRTLPRPWREAVVLRDIEGRSAAEAAHALGIGERALKSRLHRARVALREALERHAVGPGAASARPPVTDGAGCPDLPLVLSRYLEGELSARTCAELEAHVSGCASCGPTCDELLASLSRCRAAGEAKPPLRVRQAVRAALRGALATTRGATPRVSARGRARR